MLRRLHRRAHRLAAEEPILRERRERCRSAEEGIGFVLETDDSDAHRC
jgi:hypothetical protein